MPKQISITAIVTCYNEADYIGEALASILNQSETTHLKEVIVVDDGSTDSSVEVIQKIAAVDKRIKLVEQQNGGLSSARNNAIRRAKGTHVAILDGDDLWAKDKLDLQVAFMQGNEGAGVYYGDYLLFGEGIKEKKVTTRRYSVGDSEALLPRFFQFGGPIIPSTAIVSLEVFEKIGLFDETIKRAEEVDLWLRAAEYFSFQKVDGVLLHKRVRGGSNGELNPERITDVLRALDNAVKRNPTLAPLRWRRLGKLYLLAMRKAARSKKIYRFIQLALELFLRVITRNFT